MSLKGSAFLALWNDVDPARDAEYNCWHTFEHVPERVGIPGILSGRRYIASERAEDRYFTLYDLDGLRAVASPEYVDVADHPTAWSRSMRPSLRNFQRHPCTTVFSRGMGVAGSIATCCFMAPGISDDSLATIARSALDSFVESAGITSIHLGVADSDSRFPIGNARSAPLPEGTVQIVLLVEATARARLDGVASRIGASTEQHFAPTASIEWKTFDLVYGIERSGLRLPTTHRQPERNDLRVAAKWV